MNDSNMQEKHSDYHCLILIWIGRSQTKIDRQVAFCWKEESFKIFFASFSCQVHSFHLSPPHLIYWTRGCLNIKSLFLPVQYFFPESQNYYYFCSSVNILLRFKIFDFHLFKIIVLLVAMFISFFYQAFLLLSLILFALP